MPYKHTSLFKSVFWGIIVTHWLTNSPEDLGRARSKSPGIERRSRLVDSAVFVGVDSKESNAFEMKDIQRESKITYQSEFT